MADESKPLFHPEVLRQQVRSFNLPQQAEAWQPKLEDWANLIRSGRANELTETTLLPDFLTDFFYGLLGYAGPGEAPCSYTFSRAKHLQGEGNAGLNNPAYDGGLFAAHPGLDALRVAD